jgi:hypothetical protein
MFARLTTHQGSADEQLTRSTTDLPGFTGMVELVSDQGPHTTLTLWRTREDAELLDERLTPTASETLTDEIYAVDDDRSGPATHAPTVAFVGRFDGPVSTQQLQAAQRRGAQIGPRLARLPGFVRVVVLWHPTDRKMTVVHLAESADALRTVTEIVRSTPLSPDDDPAQLRGPDSVERHHVRRYQWVTD